MSDPQGVPIVERRSRNRSILLNFLSRTVVFSVIITLLFYGPVFILVAGADVKMTNGGLAVIALALLAVVSPLVAFMYRGLWRQLGTRILVFPDRIEHIRRQETICYRWDDIQSFYGWGFNREAITHTEIDWHYLVSDSTGHQFSFHERLDSKQEKPLGHYIESALVQCRLPQLRNQFFEKNEDLVFGPFVLQFDGLRYRDRFLPWCDADYIWTEDGSVRVRRREKTFNWCNVEARKVPNLCLLVALAKERIEVEEAKAK